MTKYILSYYRLVNNQWEYNADIVEADSPKDIKLPNATLYYVQVEEYSARKCNNVVVTDLPYNQLKA